MMLTELNRITLLGICLGCSSGLLQSILENYLATKFDKQRIDARKAIYQSLILTFGYGIILGVMGFAYAIWEPNASELEINRFNLVFATWLGITPIFNRFISWLFSWFKSFG